jgi:heme exporter protein A
MLTAKSLSCQRGRCTAFRHIGFELGTGDLLLVSGKNGSGKSSLLRVLAGFLPPCEGEILWQKQPVDFALHRQRLHYIGHLDALKPELTAIETVRYWAALYRVADGRDSLKAVGLDALGGRTVRHLSAGQKKRLALARLLLRKAPLWLLDEPATALDEDGQTLLNDLIRQHRADNGLVVLASHHKTSFAGAEHLVLESRG